MPKGITSAHPDHLEYDVFNGRLEIGAGPFSDGSYLYAMYFDSSFHAQTGGEDILFSLRYCAMYPGEPKRQYGQNEYRRIYRGALPTDLEEGIVQTALDEYSRRRGRPNA